ncbi:MAG: hypothetical protein VBE63_15235, partial [Lamprobacter sp.]|uniref:hypothetical protein n=1 Tax=Lamprobacter sp. TaxID=3100796 RepID=UPI002B25C2FE
STNIFASNQPDHQRLPKARRSMAYLKRDAKHNARRAQRQADLQAVLGNIEPNTSYHLLTSGDLDAGDVLDYLVHTHGPFASLWLTTWSLERQHLNTLEEHFAEGRLIDGFTAFTGDFFASRMPANYTRLCQLAERVGGRVYRLNNHAKIMLLRNPRTGLALYVEGSANYTKNPRIENCCITADQGLYDAMQHHLSQLIDDRHEYRIAPHGFSRRGA